MIDNEVNQAIFFQNFWPFFTRQFVFWSFEIQIFNDRILTIDVFAHS